jgi:tyrosine-specific transport protein
MLGKWGRITVWVLYLFLFYALSVAYIADSGHHLTSFLTPFGISLPVSIGSVFFVLFFGWIVYLGTKPVDLVNRVLMAGKILAYVLLLFSAFRYVELNHLKYVNVNYMLGVLPILVLSFGFHNMIPTLSHYLGGDIKRIRLSILGGVAFTLIIYLFWQIIALGTLPVKGSYGIFASFEKGIDAASSLKNYIESKAVGNFAQILAFFAILTSFLAQTLSLVHFLSDGLKISPKKRENGWILMLALLPPLVCAILYPGIFYKALGFAGGVSAVIVFGIFPVVMCYRGRYLDQRSSRYEVFGGKPLLALIFAIATLILVYQLSHTF